MNVIMWILFSAVGYFNIIQRTVSDTDYLSKDRVLLGIGLELVDSSTFDCINQLNVTGTLLLMQQEETRHVLQQIWYKKSFLGSKGM